MNEDISKLLKQYNDPADPRFNSKEIKSLIYKVCKEIVKEDQDFIASIINTDSYINYARWDGEKFKALLCKVGYYKTIMKYKIIFKSIMKKLNYEIEYCNNIDVITIAKTSNIGKIETYNLSKQDFENIILAELHALLYTYIENLK